MVLDSGPSIAGQLGVDIASLQDVDESAVIVVLDGVRVAPDVWEFVFPADDQSMVVVIRPGFNFDDILGGFVGLAVAIAAIYTGGLAAAAYGPLWGAVATAGTMLAGNVLVNALLPQRAPALSDRSGSDASSTHLSISGTQNTARKYGMVARVFGRVRRYPDLAAASYTEVVGENIFYRLLFDWGYGPLEISQLKIGETPLDQFEGVEIEHSALTLDGETFPDRDLTLFPSDVHEESLSILLESGQDNVRTGQPNTDESIVDLVFPEGLRGMDDEGNFYARTVGIRLEYTPTGTENWKPFGDAGGESPTSTGWLVKIFAGEIYGTGGELPTDITINAKYDPQRRLSFRVKHDERGQYDYRLRRLSADNTSNRVQDKVVWAAIRCITAEPPVDRSRMEPVARTAMRIKASDELNGVIDKFNGICEAIKPVYDSDTETWTEQKTRNAAWAMVDVLHSPVSGHGKGYDVIDVDEFADLALRCETRQWYFDAVIDYDTNILDLFSDIGDVCRAALIKRFNLWSVVQDKPQTIVRQKFSAKNSWGFRYSRERTDPCHGLRMRFKNEEADFVDDELEVYAEGYSKDGSDDTTVATIFEDDECFGVVQPHQVAEIGTMKMAKVKMRPENWSLQTGYEGYVVGLGDLVKVAAVEIAVGLAQGRIMSVERNGSGQIMAAVVDEPCRMEAGKEYCLEIRFSDGTQESRLVVTNELEAHRLEFANDDGIGEPLPVAIQFDEDDYCHFGEAGRVDEDMIVKDINYGQNGETSLEMEHAAPELHGADADLPAFDSNVTDTVMSGTPAPTAPVIVSVVSDRGTATPGADGVQVYRIVARFRRGSGLVPLSGYQVRWREVDGDWQTEQLPASATIAEYPFAVPGTVYEFRIRAVSDKGMGSDWAIATDIMVDTGSWDDPAKPVVSHEIVGEWVKLSWQDCKTDWPIRDYVVDGTPLGPGLSTSVRIAWTGNKTWSIKAVDVRGKESAVTQYTMSVEPLPVAMALACQAMTRAIKVVVSGDVTETLGGFEIWAALTNDREQAALMGMTDGDNLFTHPGLDLVDTRYYWCRARDVYGTTGEWYPAGQYAGVRGDTDPTPMDLPDHSVDESKLVRELTGITGDIALEPDIVEQGAVVESVADVEPLDIRMTAAENSWAVKLSRGNRVAGMGLLLDEQLRSEFAVLADRFCLAVNDDGELIFPFVVNGDGVDIRGDLIATGSIVGSKIAAGAITGEQIHSESKITVGDGGMFRAEDGSYAVVTSGTETVFVMGDEGTVDSVGGISSLSNYVKFTGRDIQFMRYMEGEQRAYKALKRFDTGVATNGQWTPLNGFWEAEPEIQLSPCNLTCYDADSPNADQSLNMQVTEIRLKDDHTNVYEFKANARLVKAAGTYGVTVGLSDTKTSAQGVEPDMAQTSAYQTDAECTALDIQYSVQSVKSTGVVSWYDRRQVLLRVMVDGVQAASRLIDIGETLDAVSGSIEVTCSSAGVHDVYLTALGSDASGDDFRIGDPVYVYADPEAPAYPNVQSTGGDAESFTPPTPTHPGTGYELLNYTIEFTLDDEGKVFVGGNSANVNSSSGGSASFTTSSLSSAYVDGHLTSTYTEPITGIKHYYYSSPTLTAITVTAHYRKEDTTTSGGMTSVIFQTATVTLSSANVLATGTVNYLAIQ